MGILLECKEIPILLNAEINLFREPLLYNQSFVDVGECEHFFEVADALVSVPSISTTLAFE
jgi:hypothetical protein